ncbi:MAG: dihydrolipoamide acetyltransferase family protein [Nevskiales bacterium]
MTIFRLPDLGEGLIEAEIREWHVKAGDTVRQDQPLVAVETDKAVVDIPSPQGGKLIKLHGKAGDIVPVGAPLVEFEGGEDKDAGSVVGRIERSQAVVKEEATAAAAPGKGFRATPAVRALAHKLNVDLTVVTPSGSDSMITAEDIQRVARVLAEAGPLEPLRGPRRAMARSMALAHAEVATVTVTDDADLGDWQDGEDVTLRLIRAMVEAVKVEPGLNAWYDSQALGRRLLKKVHLGIAVDTPDGLFVPVLRDVASRDRASLRQGLENLKRDVRARTLPQEELRGYTITLSNYGVFGGRYSDPVIVPPCVAILGAGRIREQVVARDGQPAVRPVMPLSLSFDHRCVTGGEATRFLMAAIEDLQKPE